MLVVEVLLDVHHGAISVARFLVSVFHITNVGCTTPRGGLEPSSYALAYST